MPLDERPIVRCLAAYIEVNPDHQPVKLGRAIVISLHDAPTYQARGYWIVGPDPEDMHALALWERAHGGA